MKQVDTKTVRLKAMDYLARREHSRGISDALIVEQFSEQDVDWFAVAEAVFLKKYADVNLDDPRERAKCMRYLQYKGYDIEHINALL